MGFSSRSWDYFHYSDSRGYLIFCCHTVAKVEIVTAAKSFRLFILYQILRRFSILQAKLICLKAPSGMVGASAHINFSSIALITVANCIVGIQLCWFCLVKSPLSLIRNFREEKSTVFQKNP